MQRVMDLNRIQQVIEEAASASTLAIQLPGIVDAALIDAGVRSEQLHHIAAQLESQGKAEITVSAEVELLIRIANDDVLRTIEPTEFSVLLSVEESKLRAVANTEKDWAMAWEKAIEPLKQTALQEMRDELRRIAGDIAEDSYSFQAAMVLLASQCVGPYINRIATLLNYPPGQVEVIAGRLRQAKTWEGDEVRCESWFHPQRGGLQFRLDLMVAEGTLIRRWSEEKKDYEYSLPNIKEVSLLLP